MNSLQSLGSNAHPIASQAGKQLERLGTTDSNWFANTSNLTDPSQNAASFASLFAGATQQTPPPTGSPTTLVVDRLTKNISAAVLRLLPANATNGLRTTLVTSMTNALAPPGNAPPGTAGENAAALASRLQRWIATIAGDTDKQTGQQNDIAGNILDAKSAKEIPAQQKSETESSALDPAMLARALLDSASAAVPQSNPVTAAPPNASTNGSTPNPPQSPSQPVIAMANAPDLLARMLVRAAGADALLNGVAGQNGTSMPSAGTDSTPSALAARFATALASISEQAFGSNAQGNSNGSNLGRGFSQQPDAKSASTDTSSLNPSFGATAPTNSTAAPSAQTTPLRPLVDANAVVEQVVKSMMLRTTQSGNSEIRLHLSPDHLGDVTMKLSVNGSSISANIVAQNGDVQNALLAGQDKLARSLAAAGMTLSGFSVDVSGGDAGRDSKKDRTAGFGRRYVVHEIGGVADENDSPQPSNLGPALLPNSSLELLNYLA